MEIYICCPLLSCSFEELNHMFHSQPPWRCLTEFNNWLTFDSRGVNANVCSLLGFQRGVNSFHSGDGLPMASLESLLQGVWSQFSCIHSLSWNIKIDIDVLSVVKFREFRSAWRQRSTDEDSSCALPAGAIDLHSVCTSHRFKKTCSLFSLPDFLKLLFISHSSRN